MAFTKLFNAVKGRFTYKFFQSHLELTSTCLLRLLYYDLLFYIFSAEDKLGCKRRLFIARRRGRGRWRAVLEAIAMNPPQCRNCDVLMFIFLLLVLSKRSVWVHWIISWQQHYHHVLISNQNSYCHITVMFMCVIFNHFYLCLVYNVILMSEWNKLCCKS